MWNSEKFDYYRMRKDYRSLFSVIKINSTLHLCIGLFYYKKGESWPSELSGLRILGCDHSIETSRLNFDQFTDLSARSLKKRCYL